MQDALMSRTQSASKIEPAVSLLQIAEAIHASRRRRANAFPKLASLMDGPCWDILLAVFIADQRNERLIVTAAVLQTLAAKSTVMRHLETCYERGLIVRLRDEHDRRRVYITLSEEATQAMQQYLEAVRADPLLAQKERS
jgi:DNA-binding transcriptional ArsR family regulator